ncbi:plasmid stabilization system protein ParE [Rhizobium mesoamericanum]|uniref:type II toxin-antitoxin system RelE/ParE family toxin n=1 Tax=Rhizobium mesoamericanum TaxID=1079800 RepID=UPI00277F48F4|nr:plasmid stabilization system protein ParE [Rhizobium mesoamericanum]
MRAYILTAEAESDLRAVIRYTRAQWGAAQVRRRVSALERGIANLAENKGPFQDMRALYPTLRMARCKLTMSFVCFARMRQMRESSSSGGMFLFCRQNSDTLPQAEFAKREGW